ncbi:hypothetical protein [Pseudomonas sp. Leaf58]|uniref:hypothetical protein n=2 Tax=Pseudomonas sp. Leaf58 TaxID=1736226 RepID=UPI0006F5A6CC|nr:hypothetical protein [Pseudomonas sp. Leaf58]KQN62425.1 hypothetical protein ASF02_09760 [Pseudomonas sp. Leaf58]
MDTHYYNHELSLIKQLGRGGYSIESQVNHVMELLQSLDKFAQDRQFWVIEQVMAQLNKQLYKEGAEADVVMALAQNVSLSVDNIFGFLSDDKSPELNNCLIDNLFRFNAYTHDDARIDDGLCEMIKSDQHDASLYFLDKLLETADYWDHWVYPMRRAMSTCFGANEPGPVMDWFLSKEAYFLELDWAEHLAEDRSFSTSLNMYQRGMTTLGLKSLEKTIGSCGQYDYLQFENIVGQSRAMALQYNLGDYERLCYALVTEQDIDPLLERGLDLNRLLDAVRTAETAGIKINAARVSMMGRMAGQRHLDAKKLDGLQEGLKRHNYPISSEDMDQAYQAIAYRYRDAPLVFATTYLQALKHDITINPEIAQNWPRPWGGYRFGWDDVAFLIGAAEQGSPMPREIIIEIIETNYGQWSKGDRKLACAKSPAWILSEIEHMAVSRLEDELEI